MMVHDVDLLILNKLSTQPSSQENYGTADMLYSAAVCKTNEPDFLSRPVFRGRVDQAVKFRIH